MVSARRIRKRYDTVTMVRLGNVWKFEYLFMKQKPQAVVLSDRSNLVSNNNPCNASILS